MEILGCGKKQGWLWTTPSIFLFIIKILLESGLIWGVRFFGKYYLFDGSNETCWKEIE